MSAAVLERDVVIVCCAVSAGIHAGLIGEHFGEGVGPGMGFAVSTVLLAGLAVALTRHPSARHLEGAIAVLGGLLIAYVVAVTTGLPLVHPEVEPVNALALVTKGVEVAGIVAAWQLVWGGVAHLSNAEGAST